MAQVEITQAQAAAVLNLLSEVDFLATERGEAISLLEVAEILKPVAQQTN